MLWCVKLLLTIKNGGKYGYESIEERRDRAGV